MEDILKQILNELKELKTDISELKVGQARLEVGQQKLKTDIGELKEGQVRLEVGQQKLQKNLIESLGTYTENITEHVDDKTEVLNKRVYKVESEVERLSRQ